MNKLIQNLGIDEKLTKVRNTRKMEYNKVKDNIPLVEHYNYMADIAFYPTDRFGFKYLLVVVDLANDEFDIQEMKNKDALSTLNAFKKMFTRPYIKKPYASLTTDGGTEFKQVFQKYLYDESIYHKVTRVGRHKQLGNIDALIRQLNRLFLGLMSTQELKTGRTSKSWVQYVPMIRNELNEIRVKELPEDYKTVEPPRLNLSDSKGNLKKQKFNMGDLVHVKLDVPEDARGRKQTGRFREGDYRYDSKPREIVNVLYFSGNVTFRYMVKGIKNASYTEQELFKA